MLARLALGTVCLMALAGCGGSARVNAGASTEGAARAETESPEDVHAGAHAEKKADGEGSPPRRAPVYDRTQIKLALDRSAIDADAEARLGLGLAIVERASGQPWLAAVVNRGTSQVRVNFDLRRLSLEVTGPVPEAPEGKKPPKAQKPQRCALPGDAAPSAADPGLDVVLEPGEGIVDAFDPRLYCFSAGGASPFAPGAAVTARLGWPEKTKTVWRKGKKEAVPVEQAAPFVAVLVAPADLAASGESSLPSDAAPAAKKPGDTAAAATEPGSAPDAAVSGVKELVASSVVLGEEFAPPEKKPDPDPLALVLVRGSDARSELDATVTVALVNQSRQQQRVYFRRESVSLELFGPAGFAECDAGPDGRAPDRQGYSTLAPNGRLQLTSRLVEICEEGAIDLPGLYLVRARFDTTEGVPEGVVSFHGRLLAQEPVTVRIRSGFGALPALRAPEIIHVGM